MNTDNVVVVIPIYKSKLDSCEMASLSRCKRVLSEYKLVFVAPKGICFSYNKLEEGVDLEYFAPYYFESNLSYSKLVLQPEFYERFSRYQYILIYQLDAFVFSDRLLEFCEMGYDYIGGPMCSWGSNWREAGCNIGNGGLSLRRVKSCLRMCRNFDYIAKKAPFAWMRAMFIRCEDVYFAYCSTLKENDFHVPPFRVAIEFGVANDIAHVYERMPAWLPFGCHGWSFIDYWHWKPIIESYGYILPEKKGNAILRSKSLRLQDYAIKRLLRVNDAFLCRAVLGDMSDVFSSGVVIWGWGKYGKLIYRLLSIAKYRVARIFDNNVANNSLHYPTIEPTDEVLYSEYMPILVSTRKYEAEIIDHLERVGKVKGKDFYLLSEVMNRALHIVINRLVNGRYL